MTYKFGKCIYTKPKSHLHPTESPPPPPLADGSHTDELDSPAALYAASQYLGMDVAMGISAVEQRFGPRLVSLLSSRWRQYELFDEFSFFARL